MSPRTFLIIAWAQVPSWAIHRRVRCYLQMRERHRGTAEEAEALRVDAGYCLDRWVGGEH
jgi:hypothetical protein